MRKIFKTFVIGGLVASAALTSCKKYLDVNTNPNSPTTSTPDLVLPQALVSSAVLVNTFNTYGAWTGGYQANAGGISGFGSQITYNFGTADYTGLWTGTYDNVNDYQYILNNTTATGDLKYFNAVARTMKAMDFLRLVDAYGNVPYSQAVLGVGNLTPTYDKAEDIYKACIAELNTAIATFKSAATNTTVKINSGPNGKIDVTASGINANGVYVPLSATGLDMTNWIKYANTIKLRALIRIQKVTSLSATYAAEKGTLENNFVNFDVMVNPGYAQQANKQNPLWNSYAWTYTGANSQNNTIPTTYVVAFYGGPKLFDDGRGKLIYAKYTTSNQLGQQGSSVPTGPATGGSWYTGTAQNTSAAGLGIMKGPTQSQVLMLASESYFLQAEANLIGLVAGTASANFDAGIAASFNYLDRDQNYALPSTHVVATEVTAYKSSNSTSYLVNYGLAANAAQQLEAIITQKYIALNFINSDEGWNEYRRTQYPKSDPTAASNPNTSMVSLTTLSPRADHLAGRILYPNTEYQYNTANAPAGVNTFTSLVFWDQRP